MLAEDTNKALDTEGIHSDVSLSQQNVRKQNYVFGRKRNSEYTVIVKNPRKVGPKDAFSISYVKYTVESTKGTEKSVSVDRRFSDFYKLAARLHLLFPLCIIPPLPEKIMNDERYNADVIAHRARELTRFMARVLAHPKFAAAEEVLDFIHDTDPEYTPKDVPLTENKTISLFKERFSLVKKEDDPDEYFKSIKGQLDTIFSTVERCRDVAINAQVAMDGCVGAQAGVYGGLRGLSAAEDVLAGHAAATLHDKTGLMDAAAENFAEVYGQKQVAAKIFKINVVDTMIDYVEEIQAIRTMIASRDKILSNFLSLQKKKKTPEIEENLSKVEAELQEANKTCCEEYERVKSERNADLAEMGASILNCEAALHKMSLQEWSETAQKFNFLNQQKKEEKDEHKESEELFA